MGQTSQMRGEKQRKRLISADWKLFKISLIERIGKKSK